MMPFLGKMWLKIKKAIDSCFHCRYTLAVASLGWYTIRAVAQSGSALAWGARGRGFESRLPDS